MARSHAVLLFSIWDDIEFLALSANARWTFVMLFGEPALTQAGVAGIRRNVWQEWTGLSEVDYMDAEKELEASTFIVVDDHYGELLVRSYIRNDGVADRPNVLKSAISSAKNVRSRTIRRAIAVELRRLPPRRPDVVNDQGKITMRHPDPHEAAEELDPAGACIEVATLSPAAESSRNGSLKGSANGSVYPSDGVATTPDGPHDDYSDRTTSGTVPGTYAGTPRGRGRGRGRGSVSEYSSLDLESVARAPAHVRTRPTIMEMSRTARSAVANRLATNYANNCAQKPTDKIVQQLGVAVDALLKAETPESECPDILTYWATKGLPPSMLDSVAHEWFNSPKSPRNGGGRSVASPVDPGAEFDALRKSGDAKGASRLIDAAWREPSQPLSDHTPSREWLHVQRVAWIDEHADDIRSALMERAR